MSSKLSSVDKKEIKKEFEKFVEKHQKELGSGHLYAHISKISYKEKPLFQCRVRLFTDRLRLHIKGDGKNALSSVKKCLKRIKKRSREEKKLSERIIEA